MELANIDSLGTVGFVVTLLTWFATYLNDKHKRKKEDREFDSNEHKSLVTEYTAFNERVQKREETLLNRIDALEKQLAELHKEIFILNKAIAECIRNGHIETNLLEPK